MEHVIAGKAVCFGEALQPEFKEYAKQIINNATVLCGTLMDRGFKIVGGMTENHLMTVDLRDKEITKSELDEIEGIGPAKKKALLETFGSAERIKNADIEELTKVKGITKDLAERIKKI